MTNNTEKKTTVTKFVVRRDQHRVSDTVWDTRNDAQIEFNYWNDIVNRINDGTNVTIQPYDVKVD